MAGKKENGVVVEKKNVVDEIVSRLRNLGENEELTLKATENLENGYTATIGYYAKNNRGSYGIRLKYGINTLVKIRSKEELNNIKKLVEFLEQNPQYIQAIEELNQGKPKKTRSALVYI